MTFFNKSIDAKELVRCLIVGGLVSITFSPFIANVLIILSIIAALLINTIRIQLLDFFNTKLGFSCLILILVFFSSFIYGIENNNVIASSIWGWRKFLMLPIAAVVFMNSYQAKQNLINAFWFACLILVVYSFLTFNFPALSSKQLVNGIVVRNHTTQGIFFSIATIIALANTLNTSLSSYLRIISMLTIPLFISNITIVATGRSGYIAISIMTLTFLFLQLERVTLIKRILISLTGFFIILGFILNSPMPRDRIELAKQEFISEIDQTRETSIGYRLTFWKNTINILPNYFFFGTGAGGFEKAYTNQVEGKSGTAGVITADPHNQYLKILVEHGIFGLTAFLSILILLLRQRSINPFRAIGISSLLAITTTSLFNSHFSTFNEGQFIWIFTGALLVAGRLDVDLKQDTLR